MNFEYPLDRIFDQIFEDLVVLVCQEILGIGTIRFNPNNDGGRDGKFTGIAQNYPSKASPWSGKFIVQSKHTRNPTAACSDSDFRKELMETEVVKIKKLKENGEVDIYIVFTNRKLTGEEESLRIKALQDTTGIEKCALFGKEQINLYLNSYPSIPEQLGISKFVIPLVFFEKDIKKIVHFFSSHIKEIAKVTEETNSSLKRINLNEKNEKNNLTKEYFSIIKRNSLSYFHQIDKFLKDPINKKILEGYQATIMELSSKITASRNQYSNFDQIFDHIYNYILKSSTQDELTSDERRLIYVFLHYMYYNCDIGIN